MIPRNLILLFTLLVFSASLAAQPRLVDRDQEAKEFSDLQRTERINEKNIFVANKRLAAFWYLIKMAQIDRLTAVEEFKEPQKFENTFRLLKYTPRNVYVRYVEDIEDLKADKDGKQPGNFLLAGFGPPEELQKLLQIKMDDAKSRNVQTTPLQWNQKRRGIELTQFEFIYENTPEARVAVGSRRKSLTIFFKEGDKGGELKMDMIVIRIVDDHLKDGIKHLQLIVDPTPLAASEEDMAKMPLQQQPMDDVVIFDRYNQKPTDITILGMMSNTPNFPHRTRFKQKFYLKLLNHFYRLYRMVDGYAQRDGNDYNQKVLEKLERGMEY